MKKCPTCKRVYNDSLNFCTVDGSQLTTITTPSSETVSTKNEKKPRGCLKKIIIGSIVLIIGLVALYNYLVNAATYLRTEPNEVHVSKSGGACMVEIDYDGYVWTVNHQPIWVNIDEYEKSFELRVGSNYSGQSREGSITIQSGKFLSQIVVKQNAFATYIKASQNRLKFGEGGGSADITIETDGCNWEAEYPNWITVTKDSESKVHIICPRNDEEYRTGTITVLEDNVRITINVTQSGDCNNCHGSGEMSCSYCFGNGGMGFGMYYSSCMWCGGKGKNTCGLCNGTGTRE